MPETLAQLGLASTLTEQLRRALGLAENALGLLEARDPGIDLDKLEAPPDKVIAETGMFLRAAMAVPHTLAPDVVEHARGLAARLCVHARQPRVAVGMALNPTLAYDYGAAHLVLSRAGFPDSRFDALLTEVGADPLCRAKERLPHRELEQAWLAWMAGGAAPGLELLSATALVRGVNPLTGTRDDLYALTHALLYATDFGNHPLDPALPTEGVLPLVRSLLARTLDEDDFDLAGELLLTWPFLKAPWDASAGLALQVLWDVERRVGILPSLSIDHAEFESLPEGSRSHYLTAVSYHTAFVMGLLCAVLLQHGSFPEAAASGPSTHSQITEGLLAALLAQKKPPQWLTFVMGRPEAERAGYLPFILDVALWRAVRRLDFAGVRELLQHSLEAALEVSPMVTQAAGMLSRVARFA